MNEKLFELLNSFYLCRSVNLTLFQSFFSILGVDVVSEFGFGCQKYKMDLLLGESQVVTHCTFKRKPIFNIEKCCWQRLTWTFFFRCALSSDESRIQPMERAEEKKNEEKLQQIYSTDIKLFRS